MRWVIFKRQFLYLLYDSDSWGFKIEFLKLRFFYFWTFLLSLFFAYCSGRVGRFFRREDFRKVLHKTNNNKKSSELVEKKIRLNKQRVSDNIVWLGWCKSLRAQQELTVAVRTEMPFSWDAISWGAIYAACFFDQGSAFFVTLCQWLL